MTNQNQENVKEMAAAANGASVRRSIVISEPGAAIKVEEFPLTAEEKEGLSINVRLSDIRITDRERTA
jgi:hypothetical protein